jgi:SAM-dependent methyltransferase
MDLATLAAYDAAAPRHAAEWSGQPAATDMHALLREHFRPGPTADIGCGAGRDTAWLAENGYDASGFDASEGLLREARTAHPGLRFARALLPALEGVEGGAWQNVLCETVVMHLPPSQVGPATRTLASLLRPGGTLYLSWRVTTGDSLRDAGGRLYSAFDADLVRAELAGWSPLLDREDISASSGKRVHRLVVRRPGP